ncbi:MAG: DNA-binding protein [Fischerella sp.]|nr:DNA-binding protein [Fischerella sp.]
MSKRIFFSLTLATTISVMTIPSLAQAQTAIRDLQQRSNGIAVSGRVTNIVGNNFILDDGTGQLIVDAGPRWWREINLQPGEQITVRGELGKGGEFDAFSITRADNSVIEIRPAEGPPPWAGGSPRSKPKPKK